MVYRLYKILSKSLFFITLAVVIFILGYFYTLPIIPEEVSTEKRFNQFPIFDHRLDKPAKIFFNDYQVPYIVAESDMDAAYLLGMVHMHLRGFQMNLIRHISQGRMSELFGPYFNELDHTLRLLDFGQATDEIYEQMPEESQMWLMRFVEGLNDYQSYTQRRPLEYDILHVEQKPWTVNDVLTLARLSGVDVNWIRWFVLLRMYEDKKWPEIWQRMITAGTTGSLSYQASLNNSCLVNSCHVNYLENMDLLEWSLNSYGKLGSNSSVIAGNKTATGKPIIANDPHLGFLLPNTWLIVGLKSPSYHMVGFMVPGIPAFGFGRNQNIAWGGTNALTAASDLVDITGREDIQIVKTDETIETRFGFDYAYQKRFTEYGPIISDAPFWPIKDKSKVIALKWMGHQISDELTALLKAMKAKNADELKAAYKSFSLPAQNLLYAEEGGDIGQLLVTHLPNRFEKTPDIFITPEIVDQSWAKINKIDQLPEVKNPQIGLLASANNRPTESDKVLGYIFAPGERVDRLREILSQEKLFTLEDIKNMQRDSYSAVSHDLAKEFASWFKAEQVNELRLASYLANWDGRYDMDSEAALVFEATLSVFMPKYYAWKNQSHIFENQKRSFYMLKFFKQDFELDYARNRDQLFALLKDSMPEIKKIIKKHQSWGNVHKIRLRHPLNVIPFYGHKINQAILSTGGSRNSLMKSRHDLIDEMFTYSRYGSQSRHISDLSDPDGNYFLLLGGQDGWINSENFLDQVILWDEGQYIQMPLDLKKVEKEFRFKIEFSPLNE